MRLNHKQILITGGASGLGLALTRLLLAKKAKVAVCGRTQDKLDQLQKEIKSALLTIHLCDVTDPVQIETLGEKLPPVDILINNAGVWLEGELQTNSYQQIETTLKVNLLGTIFTTKAFLPQFLTRNSGSIVNIISTSGLKPRPLTSVYNASKFGLSGFTHSLSQELWKTKINVHAIYPGGIKTNLFAGAKSNKDIGHYMEPGPVAEVIVFALEREYPLILNDLIINRRS